MLDCDVHTALRTLFSYHGAAYEFAQASLLLWQVPIATDNIFLQRRLVIKTNFTNSNHPFFINK